MRLSLVFLVVFELCFGIFAFAETHTVLQKNKKFSKDSITVKVGDTLIFKNNEKDRNSKNESRKNENIGNNGNKDENTVSPNYALLIHACLMLSLSTYNLKVRQSVCPSCQAVYFLNFSAFYFLF